MKTFNMNEIGRTISKMRKEKNLTQAELADMLGISYQAVSNWERGESMPDISKLSELSEIFDISIDEMLGNSRSSKVIKDILEEKEVDLKNLEKQELEDLLPIIKPDQFKKSFGDFHDFKDLDFELLIILAPFLEEKDIDSLVLELYEKNSSVKIVSLAPFMSDRAVNELFIKIAEKEDFDRVKLLSFAPFVDDEIIDKEAVKLYEKNGMTSIVGLAPFMSDSALREVASKAKEKNKYQEILMIAPFLDNVKGIFDNLFKK